MSDPDMSGYSDDENLPPRCPELLKNGAILVQYRLESGPQLEGEMPDVYEKLDAMGDILHEWHEIRTITYETIPHSGFYHDRLENPFYQNIGNRRFRRLCIQPATFFKKARSCFTEIYQPNDDMKKKYYRRKTGKRTRETSPSNSSSSSNEVPRTPRKKKAKDNELPSAPTENNSDKILDPPCENDQIETPSMEPDQQLNQMETQATETDAPSQEPFRFRPRRHPATYQPHSQHREPASCLLFRPQAGSSLHENRAAVARDLQRFSPKPTAVRRIREGGLAMDFPLDQNLDELVNITHLANIPVIAVGKAPPELYGGTSRPPRRSSNSIAFTPKIQTSTK